jgi:aminoglycoside 3-N-acetyltransferase
MATAMIRKTLARLLNDRQKRALKSKVNETRQRFFRTFLRYDGGRLVARLRSMGISDTDTLLVHANFEPDSGFEGNPTDVVNAFVEAVGHRGNLLMVSIPFRGAAVDYLKLDKVFNVKKTISMMGLVTEMFRRKEGTLRSLHPTHPVLAYGKDAPWIVDGHERCRYPCGPGTPFEKFRTLGGKILFFDVGFEAITFFHYVEHLLAEHLPFRVYDETLFSVRAVDRDGAAQVVETYAYNKQVPRRADKLHAEMARRGRIRAARVGNSRLALVTAEDVVAAQTAMVQAGDYPYDL